MRIAGRHLSRSSPLSIFYSIQSQAPAALLDHFKPHLHHERPKLMSVVQHLWLLSSGHTPYPTTLFYKQLQLASHNRLPPPRPLLHWLCLVLRQLPPPLQAAFNMPAPDNEYYSCNSEMTLQICSGLNQRARLFTTWMLYALWQSYLLWRGLTSA